MTTNISLSSFPATLAFTANGASGATQEYVIKLSLSPGTYQLSVLPDLMVVTTAQGAVTADDVNVFIPEAVIGTPYVTRAIDYWDSNGQLHSYDSSIFDLATTDDTIATAIVASEGYLPNYGGFTYYTANITIAPQQTITYTDGSRYVYTSDYYLHVIGSNLSYALGTSGLNTSLSGRFLITTGNPTGQRTQAWGNDWLNIQYVLDGYDPPDVTLPTTTDPYPVISIPDEAMWTSSSDHATFVSPQYNYDSGTGHWSLATGPAAGSYDSSQAYLIEGDGRSSYLEAVSQTCAWGAILAQAAQLPSVVQNLYSAASTAASLYNLESNYLKDLLGFLDRAPNAIVSGNGLALSNEIDARLSQFDSDTHQMARDALVDSVAADTASASIVNFFRSLKIIHHQSTEFYTVMPGDEAFVGGSHKDTMIGSSLDDVFSGGDNDDVAMGMGGNDTLTGGSGNDTLDGGSGVDIACYSGNRSSFSVVKTASGYTVTDNTGSEGTDTITNIEQLNFADMHVNLLVGDKAQTITASDLHSIEELYVAFFNRVPDADGLSYWIDAHKAGMTLDQMCENFYLAAIQYSDQTGYAASMTNDAFVRIVYANVLGRTGASAPPDADVQYWSNQLTSGASSKGALVATMLTAARDYEHDTTWYWVTDLLNNKITVADYFAVQQGLNYNTPADSITHGMEIAAAVTSTDTAAAIALIGVHDTGFSMV